MTGLPTRLHLAMHIFCARNTFSVGISTPRSPRATMIPSDASSISLNLQCRGSATAIFQLGGGPWRIRLKINNKLPNDLEWPVEYGSKIQKSPQALIMAIVHRYFHHNRPILVYLPVFRAGRENLQLKMSSLRVGHIATIKV